MDIDLNLPHDKFSGWTWLLSSQLFLRALFTHSLSSSSLIISSPWWRWGAFDHVNKWHDFDVFIIWVLMVARRWLDIFDYISRSLCHRHKSPRVFIVDFNTHVYCVSIHFRPIKANYTSDKFLHWCKVWEHDDGTSPNEALHTSPTVWQITSAAWFLDWERVRVNRKKLTMGS